MTTRQVPTAGSKTPIRHRDPGRTRTTVLTVLDDVLGDNNRTANAKELLATAANAISRTALSLSVTVFALTALALVMTHSAVADPLVLAGAGLTWGARRLWKHIHRKRSDTQTSQ